MTLRTTTTLPGVAIAVGALLALPAAARTSEFDLASAAASVHVDGRAAYDLARSSVANRRGR